MELLSGYQIEATDGKLGHIEELYFDVDTWVVRYIVVNVGNWLLRHPVLLTPSAIDHVDREAKTVVVTLTQEQVKNSPEIDTCKTISRESEEVLHKHYDWAPYWQAIPAMMSMDGSSYSVPVMAAAPVEVATTEEKQEATKEVRSHLCSTQDIIGYGLHANDGHLGHVETVLVDTLYWVIRYIIVDTGNWLRGKQVLIAPLWVSGVRWAESDLYVGLSQEQVKTSPEYDPNRLIYRGYEANLHQHYGQPPYWHEDVA